MTTTLRLARSESARFESASWAWMLMVPEMAPAAGMPHTVRGAVAQVAVPGGKSAAVQPPASVPVASNFRPAGRLEAV